MLYFESENELKLYNLNARIMYGPMNKDKASRTRPVPKITMPPES